MSAEASRVSVIVPTFNRAEMLRECVESLLGQTLSPLEIIIVDDGSTDETPNVARAFPSPVRYLHKENGGKAAALNFALPQARGSWIWFFDDDDVALASSIEDRLAALAGDPDATLVVSRFLWGTSGDSGRIFAGAPLHWPEFTADDFYPKFLASCFAHMNGALISRARIAEVGEFRTDLLTSEDYDFTLRAARGQKVALCNEPTFIFRQHQGARGPQGQQYKAAERVRKFADGDADVGRWIRSSHRLGEFIGVPFQQDLDRVSRRDALLARLQVMASKGLVAEVAEDATALAVDLESSGERLSPATAEAIKRAMQGRYLTLQMCETPAATRKSFAPLRGTGVGRSMLHVMTRAIVGSAWWQPASASERLKLARLALRLHWLAPTLHSVDGRQPEAGLRED